MGSLSIPDPVWRSRDDNPAAELSRLKPISAGRGSRLHHADPPTLAWPAIKQRQWKEFRDGPIPTVITAAPAADAERRCARSWRRTQRIWAEDVRDHHFLSIAHG